MTSYVLITDRGGHLHNALELVKQIGWAPSAMISTLGPDIEVLKNDNFFKLPPCFQWWRKYRFLNPYLVLKHIIVAYRLALRLKPEHVISLGATNVVVFCYFARFFGARIIHVECMNQVKNPSLTGRLLYPICSELYVQWKELLRSYGPKARYEGWVL